MMLFCSVIGLLALVNGALSAATGEQPPSREYCTGRVGDCVCQELKQALPNVNGTLFPSDGAVYQAFENENYSSACRLPAACIVNPTTAQEVATAVKILTKYESKFAVRSGGHNYIPGFASTNESGVLISLSLLNDVTLSDDKRTVQAGAGARWNDVYAPLTANGLTAVGAREGFVGVGGLILGGGLSYFSTAYGLSLDTVQSFEVVLGDGSIVQATAINEHAELYKALRGGGSNLGIVTSYNLYTYPIGNILIDARAYAPNQTEEFFNAFAEYQKNGQQDPRTSVTVQVLPTGPTLLLLYSGSAQKPEAFAPFYALESYQPILPAMNGSFTDVLNLSGSRFVKGDIRVYGETFSHVTDATLLNDLYNIFVEETARLPVNATGVWVPNPISPKVATIGRQYGGNLLGLSEVAQVWYEPFITYQDPAHDDLVKEIVGRYTERCIAAAKAKHLDLPYLFANTAGKEQKVLQSYGYKSLNFIKRVAAKYDRRSVFQELLVGGFLLRDV